MSGPRNEEMALVYRGGNRRYFTQKAALRAEAKMIIRQHCRASGDDYNELDPAELQTWIAHLADKISRGNRQFDLGNPLDSLLLTAHDLVAKAVAS